MTDVTFADMDDLGTAPAPQVAAIAQPCLRCAGSGKRTYGYVNITTYPCSVCKGTGRVTMARLKRVAGAKKAAVTRADNLNTKRETFKKDNPHVVIWIESNAGRFGFADAMADSLATYGGLTQGQLNAVNNCIAKDTDRKQANAAQANSRKVELSANAQAILTCLNKAAATGLRSPKLRTQTVEFSLAKAHSKNPGCVYVKAHSEYVGKIDPNGTFYPIRSCSDETRDEVSTVAQNPLEAAVQYGRMTGSCSCCGRHLDNAESVRLGIGPICRSKYF